MQPTENTYKVFAQTRPDNVITAIQSSAFLTDTERWTLIDEGSWDKYHHAQGNYLDSPLMDDYGRFRWKLSKGKAVLRKETELEPIPADVPTETDILAEIVLQQQVDIILLKWGLLV